ncbi:MAG: hypothetical protein KC729_03915 [Candidatus Eisenbacteria bacterium]|uniref:Uncharacterized protein n=1 Tax=Eiseniibacteriota bacterium TaxID=2212470 RepID=A0A956RNK7_UNCEI|nr:hypothetical protein [Candidatus Eisenbacteria bacterium]
MRESARIGRATGSPFVASFVLIAVLAVLLWGTAGGRSYTALMRNAYLSLTRGLWTERPAHLFYDETYWVLRYIVDNTPPDAVVLLPPRQFIIDRFDDGMIPLLASPSSAYSFLYPRVPVHFGDDSPRKDDLTYVLVWKGWGRENLGLPPGNGDDVELYPWPQGARAPW